MLNGFLVTFRMLTFKCISGKIFSRTSHKQNSKKKLKNITSEQRTSTFVLSFSVKHLKQFFKTKTLVTKTTLKTKTTTNGHFCGR